MSDVWRKHWPEYLMEAAELGIFMISAAAFGVLLGHPGSPIHQAIPDAFVRRVVGGCAMGVTAICLIYSPWGKQSGAHMNPSLTLTFFRLGKVKGSDALYYVLAQFAGAVVGIAVAKTMLGASLAHPSVNYVATLPGPLGMGAAFAGEFFIAFVMMSMVLRISASAALARYTGMFAGILIALYITFEDPLSGMSMNPARTFGSAVAAMRWDAVWIYFTAPPLAMLAAAEVYVLRKGGQSVACAKYHHQNDKRCIHCGAKTKQLT
jgi:aquaporin Z